MILRIATTTLEYLNLGKRYARLHSMANLDWNDLSVFLIAARARSFSDAAEQSQLTQSTISRKISNLETELDVLLFHRTAQGTAITAAGSAILEWVMEMELRVQMIRARAAGEKGLTGQIKLCVSEGVGAYWFPKRLKKFYERYPEITVEIFSSVEPPSIGAPDVDIALSRYEPDHPDAVILSKSRMVLMPCASKEYLQMYGEPTSLSDLRNHRLCSFLHYPKEGEWKIWADIIDTAPNVSLRTNSAMALGAATINGVGISLQPISLKEKEPNLIIMDLDGYAPALQFWLSCHRQLKDIPKIRALIEFIKFEFLADNDSGSAFSEIGV